MKFIEFEKFCRANELKVFTLEDCKMLFNKYSPAYLRLKLARWKQKGYLTSIKRGIYVFTEEKMDEFQISAKLITPSYISLETALSHYSIIPDVSFDVSAITTKNTRYFKINNTPYHFFHIKNSLFTDFISLREDVFIATPEKAILDYFYYKNPSEDDLFFERLNKEVLKKIDFKKMDKLAKEFPNYVQNKHNHFKNVIIK